MPRTTRRRPPRRVLEGTVAASLLAAVPSLLSTVRRDGVRASWRYGVGATRAIATLVPPGRPDVLVGAATHFGISAAFGQVLGRLLPIRHSVLWGAAGGAAMGLIGAGVVGRRFPAIRALPFGRQLADNVAFGIIFAVVADRPSRQTADSGGPTAVALGAVSDLRGDVL